jgi:hypothetical protein
MTHEITLPDIQAAFNAVLDSRRLHLPDAINVEMLTKLAVPEAHWDFGALYISSILTLGRYIYEDSEARAEYAAALDEIAAARAHLDAAYTKLANLTLTGKAHVDWNGCAINIGMYAPDTDRQTRLLTENIANTILLDRFHYYEWALQILGHVRAMASDGFRPPPQKGRKLRNLIDCPKACAFDLVVCLLDRAAAEHGWHLTLSPELHTGTLLDVLGIVKPHLPAGFVPEVLDVWRLRDLRRLAARRGRNTP